MVITGRIVPMGPAMRQRTNLDAVVGAILGAAATWAVAAPSADKQAVTLVGAFLGFAIGGIAGAASLLKPFGVEPTETVTGFVRARHRTIGTILIVGGVGVAVWKLPEALGYAFANNPVIYDLGITDPTFKNDELIIALGVATAVGGLFLRQMKPLAAVERSSEPS